jgi:O-antigen/teichoic acid export membrane protein
VSIEASERSTSGPEPADETRRYGRDAGYLGVALGVFGALTYLYFAIASHTLGREAYGDLVVLWAGVFIIVATLYRPVEQLLTRSIARCQARDEDVRPAVRNAAKIQAVAALAFLVAAVAARVPIEDELLSGNAGLYYVFLFAVLGYAASFFARGLFAGTRRFGLYAALIMAEAVARIAIAVVVAVGLASGDLAIATGIALGPVLSLLVVPFALRGGLLGRRDRAGPEPAPSTLTTAEGGGFAVAVLFIMGAEQVLLNGGPLFVRLDEGTAAAGYIFNVLMLVRAPLLLFQAVATSLLPHLTRLSSVGGAANRESFSDSLRVTFVAIAGFTALLSAVVAVAGPTLMQIAFGDNFEYPRGELLLMCAAMGLYLASWTFNQAALARGRARAAASSWVAAAVVFVTINLLPVGETVQRTEFAFLGAAFTLLILLAIVHRTGPVHIEDVPARGTAEELEARVALADETGT